MSFSLDTVVPWGRSYDEYLRMFDLSEADLDGRVLDCAGGPASFAAEAANRGGRVIAVDPLYNCSPDDIRRRLDETRETVLAQAAANAEAYCWNDIPSVEALGDRRMKAMEVFLSDYALGKRKGRYINASLPELPGNLGRFDIALCSHFLFTYSDGLDSRFHIASISAMASLADEVRVFPLLNMDGRRSPHLASVLDRLEALGFLAECRTVPYEFQRGGNEMLSVRRR